MGGNRIRKQNPGFDQRGDPIVTDRIHPSYTKALLKFNMTKKRIVDLCNKDFEDDPFDEGKDYSTWHRAMDGHEVWEGIVLALDGLYDQQTKYPWRYLPDAPPEDDLHTWMKQLASADWWMKTLQPEASPPAFRAWFSNRPMGKKKIEDVRARVDEWWALLQDQVALARRYTFAEQRRESGWSVQKGEVPVRLETWDTWCKDRLEDGFSVDEVRELMVEESTLLYRYHLQLLDLASPQALRPSSHKREYLDRCERSAGREFDLLLEAGFPNALSRTPPEFDPGPIITEHQWGDRRQERCFKDLNIPLYNLWYRTKTTQWWDPDTREVKSESVIVQVSVDGENWRDANDRERQGWDSGDYWFAYVFEYDNGDMRNSYQRERDELLEKRKPIRKQLEYSADGSELEARARAQLEAIERELATLHLGID